MCVWFLQVLGHVTVGLPKIAKMTQWHKAQDDSGSLGAAERERKNCAKVGRVAPLAHPTGNDMPCDM